MITAKHTDKVRIERESGHGVTMTGEQWLGQYDTNRGRTELLLAIEDFWLAKPGCTAKLQSILIENEEIIKKARSNEKLGLKPT